MGDIVLIGRIAVGVGLFVILAERWRSVGAVGLAGHLLGAVWVGFASQRFGPPWPLETLFPVGALAGPVLSGVTAAVIWAVVWWPADAITLPSRASGRLGGYLLPTMLVAAVWAVLLNFANRYATSVYEWPILEPEPTAALIHWFVFGWAVFSAKILATRGARLAWRLPLVLALTLAPTAYFAALGRSLPNEGWDCWLMAVVVALAAPTSTKAQRSVETRDHAMGAPRLSTLALACLAVFGGLAAVGWARTNAAGREGNEAYHDAVPREWLDRVSNQLVRRLPAVEPLPPLDEQSAGRVIMIGLDGADWRHVTPMMEAGQLPNLKRLVAQSSIGVLQTDVALSPISWTTLATGRLSKELEESPRSEIFQDVFNRVPREIPYRRVWEMAEERGLNVRVYHYYFNRDREPNRGFDPSIQVTADRGTPLPDFCRKPEELNPDGVRIAVCSALSRPFDLFMTLEQRTDIAAHMASLLWMRTRHPDWFTPAPDVPPAEDVDIMTDQWLRVDAALGAYWDNRTPGTYLVLASDHGFSMPWLDNSLLTIELSAIFGPAVAPDFFIEGGLHAQEPKTVAAGVTAEIAVVRGRLPYLRFAGESFTRYLPIEMETLVLRADKFAPPDWAAPYRERIVRELAEYGVYVSIEEKARMLTVSPKLSIVREMPYRPLTDAETTPLTRNLYVASHVRDDDGIVLIAGPGVVPGRVVGNAHLYDVAPTILYMLGLPTGRDLKGRVLTDAFDPAFLKNRPVEWIDTYETSPVTRDEDDPLVPDTPQRALAHRAMIERLRALGYLQ